MSSELYLRDFEKTRIWILSYTTSYIYVMGRKENKKKKKVKTSNYEVKEKKWNSYVILLGLLSRAANIQVTFIEPSLPTVTAFIERPLNLQ